MKPRILVVEDERAIQLALSGLLGRAGYDVSVAGSGEEALSCRSGRPFIFDDQDSRVHSVSPSRSDHFGKDNRNSAPRPASEFTSMLPPCASISFLQIGSPRPVPLALDV